MHCLWFTLQKEKHLFFLEKKKERCICSMWLLVPLTSGPFSVMLFHPIPQLCSWPNSTIKALMLVCLPAWGSASFVTPTHLKPAGIMRDPALTCFCFTLSFVHEAANVLVEPWNYNKIRKKTGKGIKIFINKHTSSRF